MHQNTKRLNVKPLTVLFVCVHNSGRSQMAEALFNQLANGKARGLSAGVQPAETVNPVVVEAMGEVGIDISSNRPKMLTLEMAEQADRIITMGCSEEAGAACPAGFVESEDWKLEDPQGKPLPQVRVIRDEIKLMVQNLLQELKII